MKNKRKQGVPTGDETGVVVSHVKSGLSLKSLRVSKDRLPVVLLIVAALIAVIGGGAYFLTRPRITTLSECKTMPEADRHAATVERIQQQDGYDRDPNCLYILTEYYLSIGDSLNSRKYFDKFERVYAGKGLMLKSKQALRDPESLQDGVEMLERQREEAIKNIRFEGHPNEAE